MKAWLERQRRWHVRWDILLERYSVWPVVGLVLMALGALAFSVAMGERRAQIAQQRDMLAMHRAVMAKTQLRDAGTSASASGAPPAWDIAQASSRQADDLKRLFQLARQRGLLVAQVDYARSTDAALSVEGLQLSMPLSGSYPQLRRFAEDALRALPHLSIDQIGFEREAIANPSIAARLRLTLWYREASAPNPDGAAGVAAGTRRDDRDPRGSGGPAWVPVRPRETLWQSPQARAAVRDIFSAHSWTPAPKPVAATLPPAPQAPPLPFTFLGKRHDGSGWDVFLGRGDHTFIVREGATIESSYRIDAIAPPTLTLTYLPLARSQTLSIGGAD